MNRGFRADFSQGQSVDNTAVIAQLESQTILRAFKTHDIRENVEIPRTTYVNPRTDILKSFKVIFSDPTGSRNALRSENEGNIAWDNTIVFLVFLSFQSFPRVRQNIA